MRPIEALTDNSRIVALKGSFVRVGSHVQEQFFVEDGWVFREHHGKYVECICRSDEIAKLPGGPQQPLLGRG